MKEQDLHVDPNYQKGFNGGYILAKHEPEILLELANSDNQRSLLFKGIKAGGDQYLKEHEKGMDQKNHPSKDKGIDRE